MVSRDGIIAVYMVASRKYGSVYIGVTGDLARRAYEHREGAIPGHSKDHGCTRREDYEALVARLENQPDRAR